MAGNHWTVESPAMPRELAPKVAPEVAQVKLVVVARPSFDFDRHVGRRAITRDLELERIARLRVPHGAGQIGRHAWAFRDGPIVFRDRRVLRDRPENLDRLHEKLEEMEKRLRGLEKKLSSR